MKALGKAGGTHQFRVEFLGGPPPIHGHQGLRGRGDTVAVQVKLALPLGIRAPVFLGAGGHEAAGPGIHLQMQTGTGHCRQEGFGQRPFGSSTDSKGYVGVPKMFLALQRTEEWQQATILVEIRQVHGPQATELLSSKEVFPGFQQHFCNKLVGHLSL